MARRRQWKACLRQPPIFPRGPSLTACQSLEIILGDFPLIGIQPTETMRMLLKRFIEQRTAEPQA
jgi:hypothetical protein